jgi:acyl carrier protein
MMNETEIAAKVIDVIREELGAGDEDIVRDTHFVDDLNADSLDVVWLVMEMEDEFDISIPDEDVQGVNTVGQAIDYIRKRLAA